MSATTKKKHVAKEVLEEYPLPNEKHQIVKVTASRGNNLHEVVSSDDEKFLVSMPSKFRKHVWIKRGDFIMIESIKEGDKVKGEISHILFKDQIKHIQDEGLWPDEFSEKISKPDDSATVPDDMLPPSDSDDDGDNDLVLADMVVNMNRAQISYVPSDSEEEEEECSDSEYEDEEEQGDSNKNSDNCDGERPVTNNGDSSSKETQNYSKDKDVG